MRRHLCQVDHVIVDLEDRDATVSMVHHVSLGEITAGFRLRPEQPADSALPLRRRLEHLAAEIVLDLGSFLDAFTDSRRPTVRAAGGPGPGCAGRRCRLPHGLAQGMMMQASDFQQRDS